MNVSVKSVSALLLLLLALMEGAHAQTITAVSYTHLTLPTKRIV